MLEVFWQFFKLGWISFGGPAAHIGYFQRHFVQKLGWMPQDRFASTLALCQFLPGPASSQLGFALGYQRAGLFGAIAAFVGFTLPSFLLMLGLALAGSAWANQPAALAIVTGLKLFALVVVADAVLSMSKQFCRQQSTLIIAILSAALFWLLPSFISQFAVLLVAALAGSFLLKEEPSERSHTLGISWPFLALFLGLLLLMPLLSLTDTAAIFADFYQAGSLVFGGGHVVLPLLENTLPETLSQDTFLTGYGVAQAMPGPMFSMASFLGAELHPNAPVLGALAATFGIFLPGFLLVLALQHSWHALASKPMLAGAVRGINAAVVGLLLAALYQPVFVSSVTGAPALAAAAIGLLALRTLRCPVLVLIPVFMLLGFWL
ncbi:chromate efflux transporter [Oceanisphaera pacifica]|uniref:Chromate efflux transporter n=1 Tax=Oceanisphaera pacifica TaxID=2818389 RepID=A0ABS3NEI3_9GAMM|nr:chromate efflux transporter [Oceanisphaera pacifica]MBO1518935.1 chromate efflux transporter [Oceanisphaera pacifica]